MPAPTLYILVPTKIQQAEQASLFPTRCGAKFALNPRYAKHHGLFHFLDTGRRKIHIALLGCDNFPISSAYSTPGDRNNCIGRCINAPLKRKKTDHRCGRSVRGRVRKKRKFVWQETPRLWGGLMYGGYTIRDGQNVQGSRRAERGLLRCSGGRCRRHSR